MANLDLFQKSENVQVISDMLKQEFNRPVIISQIHTIKIGDGNSLFYVISEDGYHLLVNIMGRKVQEDTFLFWIENVDYAGKLCEFFYERDIFVLTFNRGKQFNNEYLAYHYCYGNRYPEIKFIPQEKYSLYSEMISKSFKKHKLELPKELMITADEIE